MMLTLRYATLLLHNLEKVKAKEADEEHSTVLYMHALHVAATRVLHSATAGATWQAGRR